MTNPSFEASQINVKKWQLEIVATKASSGSTFAAFENGGRTTCGEGDAATVAPPSKLQVCSREYFPLTKSVSSPDRVQRMIAICSAIPTVLVSAVPIYNQRFCHHRRR